MTRVVPARVRLVALRQQYDALASRIDAAIRGVLERSAFVGGAEIADFERWFARYCGTTEAIGVSSGTRAIELALRALGIGPGDEVITAANTFVATAAAIVAAGARPVFADIDEQTLCLAPAAVADAITPRTRAILPVHLYGRPAAMDPIAAIAARHGLPVVEDAAQAHGARYHGRRVGAIGVAGCFSFYPTKNLGAFGDAGLVTTSDPRMADKLRLLRDHGRSSKYEHQLLGYTARLDTIQAAVLRVQADALEEWNQRRRQVAAWYRELLPSELRLVAEEPGVEPVYHLFVVRIADRDVFRGFLEDRGIESAVHYPVPIHLQPACRGLGYARGAFPVAERAADEVVSLPMHPFVDRPSVEYVAAAARDFLATRVGAARP